MGRKEDNIKRATALFTKLDNIRNIGTANGQECAIRFFRYWTW